MLFLVMGTKKLISSYLKFLNPLNKIKTEPSSLITFYSQRAFKVLKFPLRVGMQKQTKCTIPFYPIPPPKKKSFLNTLIFLAKILLFSLHINRKKKKLSRLQYEYEIFKGLDKVCQKIAEEQSSISLKFSKLMFLTALLIASLFTLFTTFSFLMDTNSIKKFYTFQIIISSSV